GKKQRRKSGGQWTLEVCLGRQQDRHYVRVTFRRRPHEGSLTLLVLGIHLGAMSEQSLDWFRSACASGGHQDGLAAAERGGGIRAGFKQQRHDLTVSIRASYRERRHAVAIGSLRMGTRFEELLCPRHILVISSPM